MSINEEITSEYDDGNIFAKILYGDIPNDTVYEDDKFLAFHDIAPAAPIHIVVIPKRSGLRSPKDLEEQADVAGELVSTAVKIAQQEQLDSGYRLIMNCGEHAGQSVPHVHLHILGGGTLGPLG